MVVSTKRQRIRTGRAGAVLLGLLALALPSSEADAQAVLYHSEFDDGIPPAVTPVLSTPGPEWLHLYADASGTTATTSGVACENGDGDEICGWQISLEARPGALLYQFVPAANVFHTLSSTTLHANAVTPLTPPIGPVKVGDLLVWSTNAATGGDVDATGLHVVTAGLIGQPVAQLTIAKIPVPEPGTPSTLAAGIAVLGLLSRLRRARSRA